MAFGGSQAIVFIVQDVNGTNRNMETYIDNISPPPTKAFIPLDVTMYKDGGENFIAGIQQSKEVTVSGAFENTAASGPDHVFAALANAGTSRTWSYYPNGTASGRRIFSGTLLPLDYEAVGPVKERVSYSFKFRTIGTITSGTV